MRNNKLVPSRFLLEKIGFYCVNFYQIPMGIINIKENLYDKKQFLEKDIIKK